MKSTERFSQRAENYVRYRPHYPKEIIPFLKTDIGLTNKWIVADIGSGTGISSEIFLQNGNRVYAVEPNKEMRQAAEEIHSGDKNFVSVNATAEATSLAKDNINLIVCGQAFHWFHQANTKKEFHRIAASGAYLLLMWNERTLRSPFQQSYEQMLLELAPAYEEVCQRQIDEKAIKDFFSPQSYLIKEFPNVQKFDLKGLKGRLLSCSYCPLEQDPNYHPLMDRLERIFHQFSVNGRVSFEYECILYYGRVK